MQNKFSLPTQDEIVKRLKKIPEGLWRECSNCHEKFYYHRAGVYEVCPNCGYGARLGSRKRIKLLCDEFEEWDKAMATDPTNIDDEKYRKKLATGIKMTHVNESVLTGKAKIGNNEFAIGVMDSRFIMGSLGQVTGSKIARMFQEATRQHLPVIMFTASGGARMQDGIHSLMQMARVSDEVARHSAEGLLYIAVITDPTTGGVTASYAMQADIIISEPKTLIGFAGRRVIEQTINQKPPKDFQQAETLLKNGFLDDIVERPNLKEYLNNLLNLHSDK
ncbi:acetyl-CoA carboxylase carboxyltransferase subunit beta [Pediococcus pentosaceus]|uniref:acetyl-CoA carboxylase carboxyltransferase subunit beta n=1 Tax=Pediococcus pentosaceus TaxID=1255 RepID=UPI0018A18281|nr:acetyl-CoA carboxylase carboxyltransferase subunit beta [Pediococcus pentosaceus]MBF7137384.1 acetyl-CoA carboxylase carboxyl transferase subunit beta [Pediococcus pentosaceus]